jgi:hypothetical protein
LLAASDRVITKRSSRCHFSNVAVVQETLCVYSEGIRKFTVIVSGLIGNQEDIPFENEGLTMGLLFQPDPLESLAGSDVSDALDNGKDNLIMIGYDGEIFSESNLSEIPWKPNLLKVGDIVEVSIDLECNFRLTVNERIVFSRNVKVSIDLPAWPVFDMLGRCLSITYSKNGDEVIYLTPVSPDIVNLGPNCLIRTEGLKSSIAVSSEPLSRSSVKLTILMNIDSNSQPLSVGFAITESNRLETDSNLESLANIKADFTCVFDGNLVFNGKIEQEGKPLSSLHANDTVTFQISNDFLFRVCVNDIQVYSKLLNIPKNLFRNGHSWCILSIPSNIKCIQAEYFDTPSPIDHLIDTSVSASPIIVTKENVDPPLPLSAVPVKSEISLITTSSLRRSLNIQNTDSFRIFADKKETTHALIQTDKITDSTESSLPSDAEYIEP